MATSDAHHKLVASGAAWFKRQGFGVIATELSVAGISEQPDVIAFRNSCSAVIEAKASRSDFFADRAKPHRSVGGLGNYRFFISPEGLISKDELPLGWGLLYASGRSVVAVVAPTGNLWPSNPHAHDIALDWRPMWHPSSPVLERQVLYSIARRQVKT